MWNGDKKTLRREILAARNRLSPDELAGRSRVITARALALPELASAPVVFLFMHFRSEVRTVGLLEEYLAQGRTVCVPHTLPGQSRLLAVRVTDPEHDLAPGYCGIPEPLPELLTHSIVPPGDIKAVFVPGAVFDPCGGRLGYGGGYYDRFLAIEAPQALRIAVAFELQVVEKVPAEPHDQFMDWVVTEANLYDCRRNRHVQDSRIPR